MMQAVSPTVFIRRVYIVFCANITAHRHARYGISCSMFRCSFLNKGHNWLYSWPNRWIAVQNKMAALAFSIFSINQSPSDKLNVRHIHYPFHFLGIAFSLVTDDPFYRHVGNKGFMPASKANPGLNAWFFPYSSAGTSGMLPIFCFLFLLSIPVMQCS